MIKGYTCMHEEEVMKKWVTAGTEQFSRQQGMLHHKGQVEMNGQEVLLVFNRHTGGYRNSNRSRVDGGKKAWFLISTEIERKIFNARLILLLISFHVAYFVG